MAFELQAAVCFMGIFLFSDFFFILFDNQNERLISPQLEVDGGTTTRKLDNLISQTEYGLAVTPVYDEGSADPMLGEAVTGKNGNLL